MINILKLAYSYKDKLQTAYQNIVFQDKYKFFNYSTYWDYTLKLEESSWNSIEIVSVDNKDNIRGFLKAEISRTTEKVSSLVIINFYDVNVVFAKDLYQFLIDLFEKHNFRKIEFTVIIGNPIEKMYDKYIQKYGGNIVGIRKATTKLQDNNYYDKKLYEIFKEDYLKCKNK